LIFEKFAESLLAEGIITDLNWIQTYLEPQIRKKLLHLVLMSQDKLVRHPSVFELFGCDMLLDSELNLYFIEMVSGPLMKLGTPDRRKLNTEIIKGAIEIELGVLYDADIDAIADQYNYKWIFDGRKNDISKYHGLLPEDCI
jgi:hypothetical protein